MTGTLVGFRHGLLQLLGDDLLAPRHLVQGGLLCLSDGLQHELRDLGHGALCVGLHTDQLVFRVCRSALGRLRGGGVARKLLTEVLHAGLHHRHLHGARDSWSSGAACCYRAVEVVDELVILLFIRSELVQDALGLHEARLHDRHLLLDLGSEHLDVDVSLFHKAYQLRVLLDLLLRDRRLHLLHVGLHLAKV